MSKSLKKLIDINRLREFKNKLVGTDSPCVQTGAVDQTIAGTKTFSKPIAGSVTGSSGSCTGNAATATKATKDAAGNTITTTYATKAENNTKANDSEVVHKSGNETISGAKTFTGNIIGINKDKSTEDANSLYSTTAGSKLTYYTTSNGGTTLTNVPATVNTILESRTIRRFFDSDWVVEQICHNSNGLYYRKGTNGTWGAWKTFAFTDSNISGNAATATTATTAKACTGNAASATKLQTARTINGIAFDGTANITIHVTAPAGVIIPFAGTSVPTGYLLCNGAAVSRTKYANLFAAIGTLYGAGDGSTTFNLPDARDRVLQGASGKHSVGSYIAAGLPNITGGFTAAGPGGNGAFTVVHLGGYLVNTDSQTGVQHDQVDFNAANFNALYGANSTVQSPAIATNFIIKY